MAVVYHVTERCNLDSVLKYGLRPMIGPRSAQTAPDGKPLEKVPRVYGFRSKGDLDNAMCNWFGGVWEAEEETKGVPINLVYIEIDTTTKYESDVEYEVAFLNTIPTSDILNIYTEDWNSICAEESLPTKSLSMKRIIGNRLEGKI